VPHHLLSCDVEEFDLPAGIDREPLVGRSMLVRKTEVVPIECVVRGYLSGSALKEYQQTSAVCGIVLPPGLRESDQLPEPIFTPATKAESGHDENVSFDAMARGAGDALAGRLRDLTLALYRGAAAYAEERGILLADTKFEFGLNGAGEVVWIDEALTPDSSRFWPKDTWKSGGSPPSYDKQFVRDFLEGTGWNKTPPAPVLPPDVVAGTRARYVEAFEKLTGVPFAA
jgi:phosphoribosylaminoimidazole-succinocarboxamide synthase